MSAGHHSVLQGKNVFHPSKITGLVTPLSRSTIVSSLMEKLESVKYSAALADRGHGGASRDKTVGSAQLGVNDFSKVEKKSYI